MYDRLDSREVKSICHSFALIGQRLWKPAILGEDKCSEQRDAGESVDSELGSDGLSEQARDLRAS